MTPSDDRRRRRARQKAAERNVLATHAPDGRITFSEKFACPVSGFTIAEIEPRLFCFNAPQGACPACDGLGEKLVFDEDLVVPNHALSIKKGAVVPWAKSNPPSPYYMQVLASLARAYDFDLDTPWRRPARRGAATSSFTAPVASPSLCASSTASAATRCKKPFEGVIGNLNRRMLQTECAWMREELTRYQSSRPCEVCHGARLKPEPLAVKIAGEDITMSTAPQRRRRPRLVRRRSHDKLTPTQREIARAILKEINERLGFLHNVGLDYLHLDRTSGTLSGGESQRIRLASQIGSGLSGVLYVLDEPSIGLHQKDNDRLLETLKRLRGLGNTVLVVEHDEDAIRTADHVIDMGPGAGVHGGEVVCQGRSTTSSPARTASLRTISPAAARSRSRQARRKGSGKYVTVHGATANNLHRRHRRLPARHVHLRHRGQRLGQVEPYHRHPLRGRRAGASTAPASPPARAQDHRPRATRQGHRYRPVADRPHPALQPSDLHRRLHHDPRLVRRPAREPRRAATSPAASASTSRAAAARRARATASSRSRCTSCPTSTSPATSATAPATTARRWR